jgi:hypothetical protein
VLSLNALWIQVSLWMIEKKPQSVRAFQVIILHLIRQDNLKQTEYAAVEHYLCCIV